MYIKLKRKRKAKKKKKYMFRGFLVKTYVCVYVNSF